MNYSQVILDLSYAALVILIAVLAVYLAFRLLGKFAKLLVTVAVIVLVLWLVFSNRGALQYLRDLVDSLKSGAGLSMMPFVGIFR